MGRVYAKCHDNEQATRTSDIRLMMSDLARVASPIQCSNCRQQFRRQDHSYQGGQNHHFCRGQREAGAATDFVQANVAAGGKGQDV